MGRVQNRPGRWSGSWPPGSDDLVTRSWRAHRRALCLLIDSSGSMSGLAVGIAALAAASLILAAGGRLAPGVTSFRNDATVLQPQGTHGEPGPLVGDLLAPRGHGVTDLAAAPAADRGVRAGGHGAGPAGAWREPAPPDPR
jgi:magnesium chelatase subunit D